MKEFTIETLLDKLVGSTAPYGESERDSEALERLDDIDIILEEAYDKDTLKLVDELGVLRSKIKRFFELHKDMPALKLAEYDEYVKLARELKKEGDFWKVGEE